jgi:hypothetical protein
MCVHIERTYIEYDMFGSIFALFFHHLALCGPLLEREREDGKPTYEMM